VDRWGSRGRGASSPPRAPARAQSGGLLSAECGAGRHRATAKAPGGARECVRRVSNGSGPRRALRPRGHGLSWFRCRPSCRPSRPRGVP
jgi:hypothetical protein